MLKFILAEIALNMLLKLHNSLIRCTPIASNPSRYNYWGIEGNHKEGYGTCEIIPIGVFALKETISEQANQWPTPTSSQKQKLEFC